MRRNWIAARDFGRTLSNLTYLTAAKSADLSTDDLIPILNVNAVQAGEQPKKVTVGLLATLIGSASVGDGDKGDITVSGGGLTWTIDNKAVTYAKIQDVSATDKLLGRSTAGAGSVEEITCTAAGRALLDDADAAAQRTTLGLGDSATLDTGTTSSTVATGDRGLPTGGTTGQVLQKSSGTDYDADWETLATRTTSANGLQPALSFAAITYGATVDLDLAALDGQYRTITLTGNITFTTSNRAAGRTVVIRLLPGASERTLTFPADWVFVSAKPATLAANKTAVLSLTFFGTADTDCVAAYGVQP